MALPTDIYCVESVRNIDKTAIESAGISGYTLMTRAGQAVVDAAVERYPDARRWQVVCGSGNNGGDGYVVARLAAARGIAVSVLAMSTPDGLSGDAATAYSDFAAEGGAVAGDIDALDGDADLLVDGLLGSGLQRDVEGRYADVVSAMNDHGAPVLALDIPSGLHGDSGEILGTAVFADLTVTFVGLKSGLFLGYGPERAGEIRFAGLDIPAECYEGESAIVRRIDHAFVGGVLPRRKRDAHKGHFGHVLVVGGAPGMLGAVRLCGEAALRAGAGLVSIATHPTHANAVSAGRPELMCAAVEVAADLEPLIERATVIALGPGLGTDSWATTMYDAVVRTSLPLVVDADGLNILAGSDLQREDWILTPHPGEAARLSGSNTADAQADRPATLNAIQQRYGGTVVLKGAGSLVSSAAGRPWLCSAGNPGMASAGMGDVLTGIIAGLRAQGLSAENAAAAGVLVHGESGDRAARAGERGLIASDLIDEIRYSVNP